MSPNIYTKLRSGAFSNFLGKDQPSLFDLVKQSFDHKTREKFSHILAKNLPE